MPISYQAALRLYAKQTGKFMVPKKGSDAYNEVKKIQEMTEMAPEHELKRRPRKQRSESPKGARTKPQVGGEMEAKLKAGVPGKADEPPPPASKTTLIDEPADELKGKKIVKKPTAAKPKGVKGILRTGKPAAVEGDEFVENRNIGTGGALAPQFAEQKGRIKEYLAQKVNSTVTVGEGEEKTLEGLKTNDPAAITARAPFSYNSLRMKLGIL